MTLPQNAHVTLETLVDRHGLHTLVELLAIVCGEKAEHIATYWQDASLAKRWDKAASVLDDTAAEIQTLGLSS